MSKPERWTEARVYEQLTKVFPTGAYALLPQVRNGTGWQRATRTADALAISCWPSRGLYLAGIEIKVSLHDWRSELAKPQKADAIGKYCKYWYLAAPTGVIPSGEVPEKWGLVEVTTTGAKIVKAARDHDAQALDMPLLCAILRKVADSTVPKDQVVKSIANAVDEAKSRQKLTLQHDYDTLRQNVNAFEDASGVKIDSWGGERIGEAVKAVLDGKHTQAAAMLKNLGEVAERIVALARENPGVE